MRSASIRLTESNRPSVDSLVLVLALSFLRMTMTSHKIQGISIVLDAARDGADCDATFARRLRKCDTIDIVDLSKRNVVFHLLFDITQKLIVFAGEFRSTIGDTFGVISAERKFSFRLITQTLTEARRERGEARGAAKRFRKIHSVKEYTGFHRSGTQWRVVER